MFTFKQEAGRYCTLCVDSTRDPFARRTTTGPVGNSVMFASLTPNTILNLACSLPSFEASFSSQTGA